MALVDGHARHALVGLADAREVGEVEARVDAVRVEVQGDGDDVEVARALAVAEEGALDAVGAGHQAELGRGDARAAVVVGVERDNGRGAVLQVAAEPLDLVGVGVGRARLDRQGQVVDDAAVLGRAPGLAHGLADLEGVLGLGQHEGLGAELEAPLGAGVLLAEAADELGRLDRDIAHLVAAHAEDDLALGRVGRGVEVDDRLAHALQRLEGAADEVLAGLDEHLYGDVARDEPFLDQLAGEGELGVRGRGEADLDLLEAHLAKHAEHLVLLPDAHRDGQGLVAVAQVDRAPVGSAVEDGVRPASVLEDDGLERTVLALGRAHGARGG